MGNVTFQHGSTAIIHLEKERTGKREKKEVKTQREKKDCIKKKERLMIAREKNGREEKRDCEMFFFFLH